MHSDNARNAKYKVIKYFLNFLNILNILVYVQAVCLTKINACAYICPSYHSENLIRQEIQEIVPP